MDALSSKRQQSRAARAGKTAATVLRADFYSCSSVELAPRLLNKLLVVRSEEGLASGRIVEVEAYDQFDPAAHSFRGPTPRCEVMFGVGGVLYVYRSYGIHWCANVVCGPPGHGAAVLLRALEPVSGIRLQRDRRASAQRATDLCSGPGKLCQALGLSGADNGAALTRPRGRLVLLDDGDPPPRLPAQGVRVGISKATERPWRWWIDGSPHVSRGDGIRTARASKS